MKRSLATAFWMIATLAPALLSRGQSTEDYELPPVSYSATQPADIISRLQARLASGQLKFTGTDREIVQRLLRELEISIESQVLVFSKTSFQRARIRPDSPRALYFSDTTYVGWVPGGLMEVTSMDPSLGPVFYSFDPRADNATERRFVRDPDCLRCHGGNFVPHIPAVFARSVFADEEGEPLLRQGTEVVDSRTPFEQRWGGWYGTGKHGKALHRGNIIAQEKNDKLVANFATGANITDLSPYFTTARYLRPNSDIVALLVFEHQLAVHNALTRAAFSCRRMLQYQKSLQQNLKEPVTEEPSYDSVKAVFETATREVVDCLLFKDEARLPGGIEGNAEFPRAFQASSRRAPDGGSLKELELKGHVFKNRCSYLIYSESFLGLPAVLKRRIFERLAGALRPANPDARYAYIPADERLRIVSILRRTHPELRQL